MNLRSYFFWKKYVLHLRNKYVGTKVHQKQYMDGLKMQWARKLLERDDFHNGFCQIYWGQSITHRHPGKCLRLKQQCL